MNIAAPAQRRKRAGLFWLGLLFAVGTGLSLPLFSTGAFAMNGVINSTQRFGIGLASLAEKECPGYRMGPGVDRMLAALGVVTQEQKALTMELAEKDARSFLKLQGKQLCDVAADMAHPGALIERVDP